MSAPSGVPTGALAKSLGPELAGPLVIGSLVLAVTLVSSGCLVSGCALASVVGVGAKVVVVVVGLLACSFEAGAAAAAAGELLPPAGCGLDSLSAGALDALAASSSAGLIELDVTVVVAAVVVVGGASG